MLCYFLCDGMSLLESLLLKQCQGLPVIGSPYGSLPELINEKVGFIAHNYHELEEYLKEDFSSKFNSEVIRKHVEEQFNVTRHALAYLDLYKKVIQGEKLNTQKPTLIFHSRAENLLPF